MDTQVTRKYTLYKITHSGKILYYGMTYDLVRRQKEHNRNLIKGKSNPLYNYLRHNLMIGAKIVLEPIAVHDDKITCQQWEAYHILHNKLMGDNTLLQPVPKMRF